MVRPSLIPLSCQGLVISGVLTSPSTISIPFNSHIPCCTCIWSLINGLHWLFTFLGHVTFGNLDKCAMISPYILRRAELVGVVRSKNGEWCEEGWVAVVRGSCVRSGGERGTISESWEYWIGSESNWERKFRRVLNIHTDTYRSGLDKVLLDSCDCDHSEICFTFAQQM